MRNLLANAEERIYFKDVEGRFVLISNKCIDLMAPGASPGDVLGKTDFDFFDEASAKEFFDGEQQMIATGESQVGLLEVERWRDGTTTWASTTKLPLRDDTGKIIGTFGISRDVTRQVAAEQALAHQALHDVLTGLANRLLFTDRLSQALRTLRRESARVGVLFIDLDKFKDINDSFGHDAGDSVLIEIAERLGRVIRPGDTVGRLGGDEFVILYDKLDEDDDLISLCDRILTAFEEPIIVGNLDLTVSASIGLAVADSVDATAAELISDADVAMYQAKQLGGKRYNFFEAGWRARAAERYQLETDLRKAIDRKEFVLVYQPLFSLADRKISALEALIRWHHPERGVLQPANFLRVAERRGLIEAIGAWVVDSACRQLAEWMAVIPEEDRPGLTLAVNVSGRQLADPSFVAIVTGALARHQLEPRRLCLEITEATLLEQSPASHDNLTALTESGVRLALDDFGSGFSALAHLHAANVDTLKIDWTFVEQLGHSERSRQLVAAMTAMAHALGMHVVAEGIETPSQLDELTGLRCDDGQGFFLAPPQTAAEITELLRGGA
jgi:diguanylate cyclase (GGDEF)-like protein/PAS domain S-box-containing protein